MRDYLLDGSTVGTCGTVSETGWSNTDIFQRWLTGHFVKYAKVGGDKKTLLLYDGHRSHITPHLIDYAVDQGIILFVLPPHTSHVLQPMDVGCFGPFTQIFSSECRKWQRSNSGTVNRYSVCSLACKAYEISLSASNLHSAFRKCGIYPFDPTAIDKSFLKPSPFANQQLEKASEISVTCPDIVEQPSDSRFFEDHLPVITIKKSKHRRSIHKIVGGQAITEPDISCQVTAYINQSKQSTNGGSKASKSTAKPKTTKPTIKSTSKDKHDSMSSQQPGPSGIDKLLISSDDRSGSKSINDDDEKCCVCGKFQQDELRRCPHVEFT
ncbi:uncharacterized protein [Haliotis cracherodii]|uniref:uncharacterized protein n=1 Tax=Haliotis cracherodii TaxID=6455 RepID=UPI0039EA5FDC